MVVNFEGSIVNLKERINQVEKRKSESSQLEAKSSAKKAEKTGEAEKQRGLADVVAIKRENQLAADSNPIRSKDDAVKLMEDLKTALKKDLSEALEAHTKADPDRVMKFYPFD